MLLLDPQVTILSILSPLTQLISMFWALTHTNISKIDNSMLLFENL